MGAIETFTEDALKLALDTARQSASDTWTRISRTSPQHLRMYLRELAEIAMALQAGKISRAEAESFVRVARITLCQAIVYTSQATLVEVQDFVNGLLDALKGAINRALPVALL
ncbi:MAG: hypothetical protein AB1698_06945 [Pseudomonadota bacterium]